jgi:hypothetical protein
VVVVHLFFAAERFLAVLGVPEAPVTPEAAEEAVVVVV